MPHLVVVESPKKAKTIQHYLGSQYVVAATAGHFRDLPDDELGVDLASFAPTYVINPEKEAALARLRKLAKEADQVFLATDLDREGEAIAWHLDQVLHHPRTKRIRFSEITATALKQALDDAGELDQKLIDAQQARRILDRLVGYQISPLLRTFGTNHSAGRVQSAALQIVVDREKARRAFKAETFFTLAAKYSNGITSRYASVNPEGELVPIRFATRGGSDAITAQGRGPHTLTARDVVNVRRAPKPPFTTATLQQAASVVLGLKPGATMALAQGLFEAGLISYHRTDSTTLSAEAIAMARQWIAKEHSEALPDEPPTYRNKASAQEAHEAIRPTSLDSPEAAALEGDPKRLYDLIRSRFLASQCKPARYDQTTLTFTCGDTTWRARGRVLTAANWLHYLDRDEDAEARDPTAEPTLPALEVGTTVDVTELEVKEGTTKPPPRFTQASLIKELERLGIGRPATYTSIVDDEAGVLFAREYLASEAKFLLPTARGELIAQMLSLGFADLVDAEYTAQLEEQLDEIAHGGRAALDTLRTWHAGFSRQLAGAAPIFLREAAQRPEFAAAAPKLTGRPCPRCGAELVLRHGKSGAFLACSAYPKCSYTADPSAKPSDRACPKCSKPMEELPGKFGRYARCPDKDCGGKVDLAVTVEEPCPLCGSPMKDKGTFLGCTRYPDCKGTFDKKGLEQAKKAQKKCPKCQRLLLERKSARGPFWGCSGYPTCKYIEPSATQPPGKTAHPSKRRARG